MTYSTEDLALIRLSSIDGIGIKRLTRLLERFETAEAVWENVASPELGFLGRQVLSRLRTAASDPDHADRLLASMERAGIRAITQADRAYPRLLSQIYDPPAVLYVRGACPFDSDRMISVVGSRRCTRDGKRAAAEISADLARQGVTIVSGLARGIDTAAHEGALTGHGRTVAVFGCGADVIYPSENIELAERILASGGSIISEYPPGTQPAAGLFPARNRIISGLTCGTLIVEGAKGSGAMITVNDALDQDRDVFAVPGSIYSSLSAMPNRLIVEGAHPVLSAWEILEAYRWAERPAEKAAGQPVPELNEEEKRVVLPLTEQPLTFEEMSKLTKIPVSRLNSLLTMLELRGIIEKVPGGMYRAYLHGLSEQGSFGP